MGAGVGHQAVAGTLQRAVGIEPGDDRVVAQPRRDRQVGRRAHERIASIQVVDAVGHRPAAAGDCRFHVDLAEQGVGIVYGGGRAGLIDRAAAETLASARRFLWSLQCAGRLLTERPLDMENLGKGGQAFLLRETGTANLEALALRLAATVEESGSLIDRVIAQEQRAATE